jgi:hypothetical protein
MSGMQKESEKRKTSWSDDYSRKYGFLKQVIKQDDKAFCAICNSKFSIAIPTGNLLKTAKNSFSNVTATKFFKSSIRASSATNSASCESTAKKIFYRGRIRNQNATKFGLKFSNTSESRILH